MTKQTKEEIPENLVRELDNQFPKGDKARGRALVLFAIAQIEISKEREKAISDILKEIRKLKFKHQSINDGRGNKCETCKFIYELEKSISKIKEMK